MTIYEMYDQSIKPLPLADRLRLAWLILDDATTDGPMTGADAMARYTELIQEGYDSGPATPLTTADFDLIKQKVRARAASRHGIPHA